MNKVKGLQLYFKTRNTFIFRRKHQNNIQFLLFSFRYFLITFFLELIRYPKEKIFILKGVINGIFLILKDKTLLIKRNYFRIRKC